MVRSRKTRGSAIPLALSASAALFGAACTHDFSTYEGGDPAEQPLVEGPDGAVPATDANREGQGDDASVLNDAAPPIEAGTDAGCAPAASCADAEDSCKSKCSQTYFSCVSSCFGPGSNGCRSDCHDKRDKCNASCVTTCESCAGASCTSKCS